MTNNFVCKSCGTTENRYYNTTKCKKCNQKYFKEYYKNKKQKFLDGVNKKYKEHKEECLTSMKKYAIKNKEKLKKYNKEYYIKNYDKMRNGYKLYYAKNKKEISKKSHLRKKECIKNNPHLKLIENLRSRILAAIKHQKASKSETTIKLLGADIETVRQHLENRFKKGMTWNNHGIIGWHIDHIKPCCSFDLTKEEQQLECFHYTNLQPLWYHDNVNKEKQKVKIKHDYFDIANNILFQEKPEHLYSSYHLYTYI